MAMVESVAGVVYDELIGSSKVPLITKNVEFAQASGEKTLKRGTLLAINGSGEYVEEDSTSETESIKVAVAVLQRDVGIYVTSIKGQDNAEALAVVDMARTDKSIVG